MRLCFVNAAGKVSAALLQLLFSASRPLSAAGLRGLDFPRVGSDGDGIGLAGRDVGLIEIPVWANCNAETYGDDVWSLMETQINHPVRFEQIIRNMANTGVDTFIEVGPGQTLSKFVKKIIPDATTLHAETPEEIAAVKEVLA